MPLISHSGSSTPSSNPNTPTSEKLVNLLNNLPVVSNPALDRMAFDTTQYPDVTNAILGYMQGHRLPITYFNQQGVGGTDIRTNIADSVSERHLLNTAYRRINNYEITLTTPWTFDYNPDTTESSVSGDALCYPGMNPLINDIFLTNGGDNKLALFKITAVTPLSWRNERAYQIHFSFYKFPQQQDLDLLQAATVQVNYFDKANYLDEVVSIFEEDRYQDLLTIRQFRTVLAQYYINTFYNTNLDTYMPPSGPYDPYVVRYMASKVPFEIAMKRPRQLQSNIEDSYAHSIWQRLSDRLTSTWDDVWARQSWRTEIRRSLDVNITPLVNHGYVILVSNDYTGTPDAPCDPWDPAYAALLEADPGIYNIENQGPWPLQEEGPDPTPTPYVLSAAFYANTTAQMSAFEQMLAQALATRQWTDSQTLINTYLNTYKSLSKSDQFYMIPFYLHLIDITDATLARAI